MTRPAPTVTRPARPRWQRRLRWALLAVIGVPLLAATVVGLSVWSEASFPSDAEDASMITRARGAVTRPIVGAVGEHVRRRVRSAAQRRLALTGMTLDELIARMNDPTADPAERRISAIRLGRVGSSDAIDALIEAFLRAPPADRAFFAQLLGSTGDPEVAQWLEPLLDDADDAVAIAAVRGLCVLDGHDASDRIAMIVYDRRRSRALRTEAVLGLGQLGTARAKQTLLEVYRRADDPALVPHLLTALGHFPFDEVSTTFEEVVQSVDVPEETRIAAVEALFHSTSEAVPFLLETAEHAPDADVRASAAWAVGAHDDDGNHGATIARLAVAEPEADVRRRLYEAALAQRHIPAERLLPTIDAESDVAARVAGFNAIAQAVRLDGASSAKAAFDDGMVPELTQIAVSRNSLNIRMRAVFALRRAKTEQSRDALRTIASSSTRQVADAARNGLRESESR